MRQFFKYAAIPIALLALATGASAQTVAVKLDIITTFDGSNLPNHVVQGPDGLFYAISTTSADTTVSFFRIDPVTKIQTLATTLDSGQEAPGASRLVLAPNGTFYASFLGAAGGGIVSFNPGTNEAAVVRTFPLDDLGSPGVDGAYPGALTLGRDGWLYGPMSTSTYDDFNLAGSLFRLHPGNGAFETVHQFRLDDDGGVNPFEALAEGAVNGVFYGVNGDATGCGKAFKFDSNTSTLTRLHTFDFAAEGCFPGALSVLPTGHLIGATTSGGVTAAGEPALGGIFTIDATSGALTVVHMFPEADGFSPIIPGNITVTPGGRVYVLVQNQVLGVASILRVDPASRAVDPIQDLTGRTPEIGMLTVGSDARLYGVWDSTVMFALGVLDPITVAPAGGQVGGTTTLSATLKALGMALADRRIDFSLNGTFVGFAITNALGVATLDNVSLAGLAAGTFPVGAAFVGDALFPAVNGTALLSVLATATVTPGIMLGDGYIADNLYRYEFKFLVLEKANGTDRGKLDLRIRDLDDRKKRNKRDDRFVSTSYTDVVFNFDQADRPLFDTVVFTGTGKLNGVIGYRFEAFAEDRAGLGWRGRNQETFRIVVYSPTGQEVARASGLVKSGFLMSKRLRK